MIVDMPLVGYRLWDTLADKALDGQDLSQAEALQILACPDVEVPSLLAAAYRVRHRFHGNRVQLYYLRNAKSGLCPEDCNYCSQSKIAETEVNRYVSDTEPWKIKDDPERLGTVLHVVAQCVADLNLVLSPFLPFSANEVDKAFGGRGDVAPMPRIEDVDDLDGGAPYPIITGDYSGFPPWRRRPIVPGTPVAKPTPIFQKLDPVIVDEELARPEG